jgi:hypothetical protein
VGDGANTIFAINSNGQISVINDNQLRTDTATQYKASGHNLLRILVVVLLVFGGLLLLEVNMQCLCLIMKRIVALFISKTIFI